MKKYPVFILFGIVLFAVLIATAILLNKSDVSLGYDFDEPNETIILPDVLREISGVAIDGNGRFSCIQDENGILFRFDPIKKEIDGQRVFGDDGDYEGICKIGSFSYILRSDGVLFEVEEQVMETFELRTEEGAVEVNGLHVIKYELDLPTNENEGLCFDQKNNRLLIISREQSPHTKTNERVVCAFDLAKKQLSKQPAFTLNPFSGKWKQPSDLSFRPSELALHPLTGELYVLSSKDQALFVFWPTGKIKTIQRLNPTIFTKPEGIAFMENGDVYISNEGKHEKPTLLFFQYKPSGKTK